MKIDYLKEGYFKSYDNIKLSANDPDAVAKKVVNKTIKMIEEEMKDMLDDDTTPFAMLFDQDNSLNSPFRTTIFGDMFDYVLIPAFLSDEYTDSNSPRQSLELRCTPSGESSVSVEIDIKSFIRVYYVLNYTSYTSARLNHFRYDMYFKIDIRAMSFFAEWITDLQDYCVEVLNDYFYKKYRISVDEVKCKLIAYPDKIALANSKTITYYPIKSGKILQYPYTGNNHLALGQKSDIPLYKVKVIGPSLMSSSKRYASAKVVSEYIDVPSMIEVLQHQMKCVGVLMTLNQLTSVDYNDACPTDYKDMISQMTGYCN